MKSLVVSLTVLLGSASLALADDKVILREQLRAGETAVVALEFKADGTLQVPQGDQKDGTQSFAAKGRFVFEEKMLPSAAKSNDGSSDQPADRATRSIRYYTASTLESVIDNKRVARELREPVRLIVADLRNGRPFLFSPSAPLTVDEYEMVEADASLDSLSIGELLPTEPVAVGEIWRPSNPGVSAVFNITHIGKNELQLKLEKLDQSTATINVAGHVEGICSGTVTLRTCTGRIIFDRQLAKIVRIELNHREQRKAGPLNSALDVRANYTVTRDMAAPITRLKDDEIKNVPTESNPATELLVYAQQDGRYRFYMERGWFVTMSHPQAAVLRLLENGEFISECHILPAPTVAAGTHMNPTEFRAQVQQALGKQFQQFVQDGEVPAPKGQWLYRLAAAGTAGDQPSIWIYDLVAGPQGQQLVFIFRLHATQFENFSGRDLAVVGSVEFEPSKTAANR